jgi:hypothetical protein
MIRTSCASILTCAFAAVIAGCSDDPLRPDTGGGDRDATADAGAQDVPQTPDTGTPDAGDTPDATGMDVESIDLGPVDTGVTVTPIIEPGSHVQFLEGRVEISDDFQTVVAALGSGTRSAAMNTRSYEWMLSGGVNVVIWFANTNLDDDDAPPNDVDPTDKVLWIAVTGPFTGKTTRNVGIGTPRATVEAAPPTGYGPPPHTVPIADPPGVLAQYFTTGLLVAYTPADEVRTITISRAYGHEPDGAIDAPNSQLHFGGTNVIQGLRGVMAGTRDTEVIALLGLPDADGQVVIGGVSLRLMSYGFLGIEVFLSNATMRAWFVSVHAPYYGTLPNGAGINSTRADIEAGIGLGMGMASSTSPNLICYSDASRDVIAVTYSMDVTPVATTITVPLLMCP